MWFYMIAVFLFAVGIIGGVASGGIFTLIFIPLGAIMLVVAVVMGMWHRGAQGAAGGQTEGSKTEQEPLRHTPPQGTPAPTRPEELADARRVQQ
jgi:predicted phage tail protein